MYQLVVCTVSRQKGISSLGDSSPEKERKESRTSVAFTVLSTEGSGFEPEVLKSVWPHSGLGADLLSFGRGLGGSRV